VNIAIPGAAWWAHFEPQKGDAQNDLRRFLDELWVPFQNEKKQT